MTSVLVLGGSGYLGRHVVAALRQDRRVTRVLTPGRSVCDVMGASVEELTDLLVLMEPHVVVNCVGRLDGEPRELAAANTGVTAKLLGAVRKAPARLVRVGSAGEYGPVQPGVAVDEDTPARPVSAYGSSHLAATLLVEEARRAGTAEAVTLRVFNPIGSGMGANTVLGRAAHQLEEALRDGTGTVRLGPLGAYRDFVDARDVASAVVAAAFTPIEWATINVGSGRATRVRDAVEMLAAVAGFDGDIFEAPAAPGRSVGVDWIEADTTRARRALGWTSQHSLQESLTEIWRDVAPIDVRALGGAPTVTRRPAELTFSQLGGNPDE